MGGKAIIFSAPSGSGKTTIVRRLLDLIPSLTFSISATTRSMRANETHAIDYYFLSLDEFKSRIAKDEFLEWEEVYEGNFYGTLQSEVERVWAEGNHVIFDIDVQGGKKLKEKLGEKALSIFIKVPTIEILEKRLRERSTESEETLKMRVSKASQEMLEEKNFDRVIVNEFLEEAVEEARRTVEEFID